MNPMIPSVDPIPLPAPVWIFKVLLNFTTTLHFTALYLMLGGLILSLIWNFWGRSRKSDLSIESSGLIIHRLPIIMTYVINLGVPPLLFTQVLYGRALYTSSILIGAYWISVIGLVILAYFLMYRMGVLAESKKSWWGWGLVAFIAVLGVAKIYSLNMTLMLRPEEWNKMYLKSALGTAFPSHDPTFIPRWCYMIIISLAYGGLSAVLYSNKSLLQDRLKRHLRVWGSVAGLIGIVGGLLAGYWVFQTQSQDVQGVLWTSGLSLNAIYIWIVGMLGALVIFISLIFKPQALGLMRNVFLPILLYISIIGAVLVRDGIRDITLGLKGFNVWDRVEITNWSIVGLFLLLLVLGLGLIGWFTYVLYKANPKKESYV